MSKGAASKKAAPAVTGPAVHHDHERRTCIELRRDADFVTFIPMSIEGMVVQRESLKNFDSRYSALPQYPVERAAKLYAEYAADLGGSPEAMKELAQLTNLSAKEIEMATAKNATKATEAKTKATEAKTKAAAKPAAKAAAAKPAAKGKDVPVTKGVKAPAAKPAAKEAKATGEKRSAAQAFKDLIMEGKLTDDKIFEKVSKEFGLDESKRGYVKWYRNWLVKNGQKPPAAK